MGRIYVVELEGRVYRCKLCKTHLALHHDLVSRVSSTTFDVMGFKRPCFWRIAHKKAFHSRRGKAYLFNKAVNFTAGLLEERMMLSGMHTVSDIFCCCCGQIVGWKYEAAHERSQKYKEGKFVLERGRISDGVDADFYADNHSMSDDED